MRVGEKTRTPMMRGGERNSERSELDGLPFVELVHEVEPEPMHQSPHPDRNDERLIGRDRAQGPAIEVIEMREGDENEIDRGQMVNVKAGLFQSLDYAQLHRPVRIDQ